MMFSFGANAIDWSGMAKNAGGALAAGAVLATAAVLAPSGPRNPYDSASTGYGPLGPQGYGPPGMMPGYGPPGMMMQPGMMPGYGGAISTVNGATTNLNNWGNNAMGAITPGLAPTMPDANAAIANPGGLISGMGGMMAASLLGRAGAGYGGYSASPYGAASPYGNASYGGGNYGVNSAYGNASYGGGNYGANSAYGNASYGGGNYGANSAYGGFNGTY